MTEAERRKIYHLYRHGWTDEEIAEHIHYSKSTVVRNRRKMGFKKTRGRSKMITPLQIASMFELRRQGLDCKAIAKKMGLSHSTVYYHISRKERKDGKISATRSS